MKIKNNVLLDVEYKDFTKDGKFIVPDGVTKIGESAFGGCVSLKEIHIPDSVTKIGESAFAWCTRLKKIHIPDSVTKIRDSTFYECENLKEIHIPNNVTKIGESAFRGCVKLKEIHIPNSVTEIEDSAFKWCENLKEITWGKEIYKVECVDGYCMQVLSEKQKEDVTIKRCKYFPDGKTVYIVRKDENQKMFLNILNELENKDILENNILEIVYKRIEKLNNLLALEYEMFGETDYAAQMECEKDRIESLIVIIEDICDSKEIHTIVLKNIEWEVDADLEITLPESVEIPITIELFQNYCDDYFVDFLSDTYGYLVRSFCIQVN